MVRSDTFNIFAASKTRLHEPPLVRTRANATTPLWFGLRPANRTDFGVNRFLHIVQQREKRVDKSSTTVSETPGSLSFRVQLPQTKVPFLHWGQDFPQCFLASSRSIWNNADKKLAHESSLRQSIGRTFFPCVLQKQQFRMRPLTAPEKKVLSSFFMQHEARYLSDKNYAPTAIVTQKYGFHRQTAWLCSPRPSCGHCALFFV
jgi:hypothetical protein